MRTVLRALGRWVWADRVRTSPRDGKLLRLRVGTCLRVGGVAAEVSGRAIRDGEAAAPSGADRGAAEVEYTCRTATGLLRLRVRPTVEASEVRTWIKTSGGKLEQEVAADAIEVFGVGPARAWSGRASHHDESA